MSAALIMMFNDEKDRQHTELGTKPLIPLNGGRWKLLLR